MLRSRLSLIAAAVLFSSGGAVIKACTLSSWQIAGLRSLVALLAVVGLRTRESTRWNASTIVTACAYAATMILFVTANKLTTAASTIFLQSTAPLYVTLLGPIVLRERVRRRDFVFLAALGAGMAMFLGDVDVRFTSAPDPRLGNALAALSGLTWAVTVTGLRWLERSSAGMGRTAAVIASGNALAFLACLPNALPVDHARPIDALWIVYLGLFQVAAAYLLLGFGVRGVPALEASLLLLLEPVLNPVWAWIVHGESPGSWTILGGTTILSAATLQMIFPSARRSAVSTPQRAS